MKHEYTIPDCDSETGQYDEELPENRLGDTIS